MNLPTPYYLLDEAAILQNLKKIDQLCQISGAKALLALKCFATWGIFDLMRPYLHGTTSSSLNEVRLGKETFGGETHAYSVAYAPEEIDQVLNYADKIIFNSINQLEQFADQAHTQKIPVGLRLNPKISNSSYLIADPARPFSRLGEHDLSKIQAILPKISGVMIHNNCENADFNAFCQNLDAIEAKFGAIFHQLDWISLGGGIHFIAENYPLKQLGERLKDFSQTYGVQVYLEPGEATIHQGASLVTTVLDVLHNDKKLAVVDASIEAHMLDLLIYRETADLVSINEQKCQISGKSVGEDSTLVYGKSCLAGDIFGEYLLNKPLKIGDKLAFGNAGGYTMVKKNWFNGVNMPSIVVLRQDGSVVVQKTFDYQDYKNSLS